jgi:flagellar biosynthesis/type III secretory pathway M-ring protein FliF/YscJ
MDDQKNNEVAEEKKEEVSMPEQKSPEAKPKFVKVLVWIIVALLIIYLVVVISGKKNAPLEEQTGENTEEVTGGEMTEEPVVTPEE